MLGGRDWTNIVQGCDQMVLVVVLFCFNYVKNDEQKLKKKKTHYC